MIQGVLDELREGVRVFPNGTWRAELVVGQVAGEGVLLLRRKVPLIEVKLARRSRSSSSADSSAAASRSSRFAQRLYAKKVRTD